jgi:hypothetical protein
MLQQCSGASNCMRMCVVMEEHYTACQHSPPFVLNDPMQFLSVFNTLVALLWSLVA